MGDDAEGSVNFKVCVCDGPLAAAVLQERLRWTEIAQGLLHHRRESRIEFTNPLLLRNHSSLCIYTCVSDGTSGSGVVLGAPMPEGICAQNEDLQILTGYFSVSFDDFSDGGWYPFNGKVEYTLS